jgi:AraC-like DNA-binding protein
MVCPRCIRAVEQVFREIGAEPVAIRLGEVITKEDLSAQQRITLADKLGQLGFELLDDVRQQQIEKIKAIVIRQIQEGEGEKLPFSAVLTRELHREYSQLSKLFSETEGITIEQYVILQKIEKAKELLVYNEMNLSEIAFHLGYSSVAHLSTQFKKVTGLTPSAFKSQGIRLRKPLDGVGPQQNHQQSPQQNSQQNPQQSSQ